MNEPREPIDANELERIAKERPDECFLKGSGVLKLIGAIRQLEAQLKDALLSQQAAEPEKQDAPWSLKQKWYDEGYNDGKELAPRKLEQPAAAAGAEPEDGSLTEEQSYWFARGVEFEKGRASVDLRKPNAVATPPAEAQAAPVDAQKLQREIELLDKALDEELAARDRAQDALLEASMTMGGPEWCAKIPPEPAPDSGDLHEDVPELCRQLVVERDELRNKVATLPQQPAVRVPDDLKLCSYSDDDEYTGDTLDEFAKERGCVIGDEFDVTEVWLRDLRFKIVGGGPTAEDPRAEFIFEPLPAAPMQEDSSNQDGGAA